ncbi:hypothetical protein ACF3M1_09695 [Luteimonas sp. WGS1318]|uniref:hypothetical protein n=1 Tax=Luteimonas sp. WGS1318 TaxID=3366815 RepID=UPI00372D6AC6
MRRRSAHAGWIRLHTRRDRIDRHSQEAPMSDRNTAVLQQPNAAVAGGDRADGVAHGPGDVASRFVGGRTRVGTTAARDVMAATYVRTPGVEVDRVITGGDTAAAIGTIAFTDADGRRTRSNDCDIRHLRDDTLAAPQALVVEFD